MKKTFISLVLSVIGITLSFAGPIDNDKDKDHRSLLNKEIATCYQEEENELVFTPTGDFNSSFVIEILDAEGNVIYSKTVSVFTNRTTTIKLPVLSTGTYTLQYKAATLDFSGTFDVV